MTWPVLSMVNLRVQQYVMWTCHLYLPCWCIIYNSCRRKVMQKNPMVHRAHVAYKSMLRGCASPHEWESPDVLWWSCDPTSWFVLRDSRIWIVSALRTLTAMNNCHRLAWAHCTDNYVYLCFCNPLLCKDYFIEIWLNFSEHWKKKHSFEYGWHSTVSALLKAI